MCESTSVQVRKRVKAREKKKSEKRGKREKLKWEYVRNERFSDELFKASNPATPLEAFLLKGGGRIPLLDASTAKAVCIWEG